MKTINIEGHLIDIDKNIVDAFERIVPNSFEKAAASWLGLILSCETMDDVFENYSEDKIRETITVTAKEELLYGYGVSV